MNRLHPWLLLLATFEGVCGGVAAWGYEGNVHQQLTFMAARQFNHCVESRPDITRLSALDTRYIVKANVAQADTNVFVRMFRWNYYNRSDQTNRTSWGRRDLRQTRRSRHHLHVDAEPVRAHHRADHLLLGQHDVEAR